MGGDDAKLRYFRRDSTKSRTVPIATVPAKKWIIVDHLHLKGMHSTGSEHPVYAFTFLLDPSESDSDREVVMPQDKKDEFDKLLIGLDVTQYNGWPGTHERDAKTDFWRNAALTNVRCDWERRVAKKEIHQIPPWVLRRVKKVYPLVDAPAAPRNANK